MKESPRQWMPRTPGQWSFTAFLGFMSFMLGYLMPLAILLAPLLILHAIGEAIVWAGIMAIWYGITLPLRALGVLSKEAPKPEKPQEPEDATYLTVAMIAGLILGWLLSTAQNGWMWGFFS